MLSHPKRHYSRRSPYGERGLKFGTYYRTMRQYQSLSLRRAWIEILMVPHPRGRGWSRSPYGERGLKFNKE